MRHGRTTVATHNRVRGSARGIAPRLESGEEVIATRIEAPFMGREEMVAFIEDTPERWYKRPARATANVEVLRG